MNANRAMQQNDTVSIDANNNWSFIYINEITHINQ